MSNSNSNSSSSTKRAIAVGVGVGASALSGNRDNVNVNSVNVNSGGSKNNISNNNKEGVTPPTPRSSSTTSALLTSLWIGLGLCCLLSMSANVLHADTFVHHAPDSAMARAMEDFKRGRLALSLMNKNRKRGLDNMTNVKVDDEKDEILQLLQESSQEELEQIQQAQKEQEQNEKESEQQIHVNRGRGGEEEDFILVDPQEIRHGENNNHEDSTTKQLPPPSTIGSLQCPGLPNHVAQDLVYWHDIPSDQLFVSPMKKQSSQSPQSHQTQTQKQYLTFEPDGGGWNNIRMAMETIVGLAIAMGRILVLPPAQGMYLLKKDKTKQTTDFSFAHFFPMQEMAHENRGLQLITTEEFLLQTWGNLIDKESGLPSYPPENRTNWDGQDIKPYKEWLRNVTYIEHWWKPGSCLAAFPASGNHKDMEYLSELQDSVEAISSIKFRGHPVSVDAPPIDRLHENMAGRKELCIYNDEMQQQLVIHFMCYHKMRVRYLVHFYAFLFFEDWRHDTWMKRFMRDHMRYIDEIQCAAAAIVGAVRDRARHRGLYPQGNFDTFHIRRGDFQFKDTRISAEEILQNSRDVLTVNKTLYIATDERDKKFFDPIKKEGYDVVFLDDYKALLKGVNTNYYGMIDQLVASRGDVFLGCWHSTFTGFIMRMRGYHSTKANLPGSKDGTLPTSYYYAMPKNKYAMHEYEPLMGGFFNREFPTSWRQIDTGVGMPFQ